MEVQRWKRVRSYAEHCADLEPRQRLLWLQSQNADQALCTEVLRLVDQWESTDEISSRSPISSIADKLLGDNQELAGEGSRIGPWRLLKPLGEGGMGSVYLAERVEGGFKQLTALKRVRAGLAEAEYLHRFEAERQILAELEHPHIARLLDGGCDADGSPYLALEYCTGQTISAYCDTHKLSLRERLQLFRQVCAAVSYSHQRLVVHRDIKPSNVMVSDAGQVKLLDFGVAKLLGQTEHGALTQTRPAPITPAYAAPEQLRGETVSTLTDVYALGLLLFELLTGALPQAARRKNTAQAVAEALSQDATPPSRAVQELSADPQRGRQVANNRGALLPQLRKQLRGDLDAILLKALRERPADRYPSVDALDLDIANYLDQRVVSARRGSRRYRWGRILARNKLPATLTALLAVSALVGIVATGSQANQAKEERDLAQAEAQKATLMRDFVVDIFRLAKPAPRGTDVSARDLLDDTLARIKRSPVTDLDTRTELQAIMADSYMALGLTDIAHDLLTDTLAQIDSHRSNSENLPSVLIMLAQAETRLRNRERARQLLARATPMIPAKPPSEVQAQLNQVSATLDLADGELQSAAQRMGRACEIFALIHGAYSDQVLNATRMLAWIYDEAERYRDIDRLIRPIMAAAEAGTEINPLIYADLLDAQSNAASQLGEPDTAVDFRRQALQVSIGTYGEQHRYVGTRWNNLAFSYVAAGRLVEARDAMAEALQIYRQTTPPGSHQIGSSSSNYARILLLLGDVAAAEPLIQDAISIRRNSANPVDLAYSTQISASIARAAGDLPLAAERASLAAELFAALPRKPRTLEGRLALEQAQIELLLDQPSDCANSARAVELMSRADDQRYAEFLHGVCQAHNGLSAGADLDQALQQALDAQPTQSARRKWLQLYR